MVLSLAPIELRGEANLYSHFNEEIGRFRAAAGKSESDSDTRHW